MAETVNVDRLTEVYIETIRAEVPAANSAANGPATHSPTRMVVWQPSL
jgi:hypothetical protein